MKGLFIKLFILAVISLSCSSACAKEKVGSHAIYFEDRHGNEVEVNYNGTYQYDYSNKKWLPLVGSYNFIAHCASSLDCRTDVISQQIAEDFVSVIDTYDFYTWVFEEEPPFCKPGEVCQQPKKGNPSKLSAPKETSVSQDILNWSQALKNGEDIFKQFSTGDSKATSNFLIYKQSGELHDLCVPKGTACQSVLDIKRSNEKVIEASVTLIRSNPAGESLSDFLNEIVQSGKVFSSCQMTTNCSTLSDGNVQCENSFNCFY